MFFLRRIGLDWERRAPLLLRPNDVPALGPPRLAHLKAHEYVEKRWMTQDQFDSYFKFTFVRNPWDRIASFYRFLGFDRICSFSTFVHRHLPVQMEKKAWFLCPQSEYLQGPNGASLVDFVGRFESLASDFARACERMGIADPALPHVNDSKKGGGGLLRLPRRRPLPYREMYDARSREIVGSLYASDVEAFAYDF
jgi:hypothetical protein